MKKKLNVFFGCFVAMSFVVGCFSSLNAQENQGDQQNSSTASELDQAIDEALKRQTVENGDALQTDSAAMYNKSEITSPSEENKSESSTKKSVVQNAVLEGIQISSEAGEVSDEKILTCYFIFRDKPTSYFYEAKIKEKLIVFEFNDVELGASPIPSSKELPIQGFRIETEKVDANKEVVGLTPEWHDIVKVRFYMDGIPEINVKDEYSVISFSFRWSTNPDKQKGMIKKEENKRPLVFSLLGGAALVAGGVLTYFLLKTTPEEGVQELSADDLPPIPTPRPPYHQ